MRAKEYRGHARPFRVAMSAFPQEKAADVDILWTNGRLLVSTCHEVVAVPSSLCRFPTMTGEYSSN